MAGKKYGLGEKYKALGVGKATLSINPMQDDLKKLKGMGAAIGVSSKFAQRALIGGGKTKIASAIKTSAKDKIYKGVLKTHNALKDAVTSKAGIGATGSAVGYELGKLKGKVNKKMYGGAMKVQKANVGLLIKGMKVTPKLIKKFFSKTGDYPMSLKNKKALDTTSSDLFMKRRLTLGAGKTLKADRIKRALAGPKAIAKVLTSKAGLTAQGVAAGYDLGKTYGNKSVKGKVEKKMYGGAMKKMDAGGAAIKGKGAVVGGSGLQDEKLKPGKKYKVKKASLGVLMGAGMRNKKVMGAGALGLLSMLAKKK